MGEPLEPGNARGFPRHRLDALTDGIFAVAMTLLVLELRLPSGVDPKSDHELIAALVATAPQIGPYVLSFLILAIRWREQVAERARDVNVGKPYVNWMLVNLLLVTFVPFTTLLIGRYGSLAPAEWLYAANLAGMAFSTWLAAGTTPSAAETRPEETAGMLVFMAASAAVVALSFLHTSWAPMGFMLNALDPPVARWVRERNRSRAARGS